VNSEESYQNLIRFFYGDIRADGYLDVDDLTLPPDVQQQYEAGKDIKASYLFEVTVSVRGKQWQLHRRTADENSAIFRKFDELLPQKRAGGPRKPDRNQSPLLFNIFLDKDQRTVKTRPTLAFSVDICVRVPEYQVDGFLFLKNHFEGGYLFRDMLTLEATPPATDKDQWKIEYSFANERDQPPRPAALVDGDDDTATFEIPIEQPNPPGIRAKLRVVTRIWNDWQ
jgi:hypothetical protein